MNFVKASAFERGKGPFLLISISAMVIAYFGVDQLRRSWHVEDLSSNLPCGGSCEIGRISDYSQYGLIFHNDAYYATDVCFELPNKTTRVVKEHSDFEGAMLYNYDSFEDCVASQAG